MPTVDRAPVLVDEQIGRTRFLTPEGFLFCEGVRIARTGSMLYRADEVPDIEPSGAGMVTIQRSPEVLFDPNAIASFNGKPVTNDHPPQFVEPDTWRQYSIGTVLDPRRGEGVEADYLIADLLITDRQGIDDVLAGKLEVSCGYDAPREQVKPGLGRQIKVIGNHVALVERGRAGPACAIQDQEPEMAVKKRSVFDRLRTAFKANDEAAFEEEMEKVKDEVAASDEPQRLVIEVKQPDMPEAAKEEPAKDDEPVDPLVAIQAAIADLTARVAALEAGEANEVTDEDAPKKDEEAAKDEPKKEEATTDSAALRDAFADVRAKAEILFPGINLPTFDAKSASTKTADAMHDLRVRTLKAALADQKRAAHVKTAAGGADPSLDTMTADGIAVLFNAAASLAASANTRPAKMPDVMPQGPMTAEKYAALIKQRQKRA